MGESNTIESAYALTIVLLSPINVYFERICSW